MKIPLHSSAVWKRNSLENIQRWENRPRIIVTNTILAYRLFPNEIKKMCESILINWKTELTKPIRQMGRKAVLPYFGDHIRLSLGHPDLVRVAKQTAIELNKVESQSPGQIPEHLKKVVNQIINEEKFPNLTFEDND